MQSWELRTALSKASAPATAAATGSSESPASRSSAAAAASHASARTCSVRHSMSAARCLMDWNEPIVRPNCSRILA